MECLFNQNKHKKLLINDNDAEWLSDLIGCLQFFYQIIFCVDLNFFLFLAVNNVRTLSSYTILTSLTNNYKTITMHSTPLSKKTENFFNL